MTITRVLWVDDDSPPERAELDGVIVETAQSCKDGAEFLKKEQELPDCVVVDLSLPQGGWKKEGFLEDPGIPFINELKEVFGDKISIVAYTAFLDAKRSRKLQDFNVDVHSKMEKTFRSLLRELREFRNKGEEDRDVDEASDSQRTG